MRRRATIAEDRAGVAAELDKISAMEARSRSPWRRSPHEQEATDLFQKQGGDLKLAIAKLEAARGQVEAKVSPQLLDVYNRTAARSGVAIGVLDGNAAAPRCTVIDGGRLIDLRNQAPLGMCLVQAFAGDRIISAASPRALCYSWRVSPNETTSTMELISMSKVCEVCGKHPVAGRSISHFTV